MKETDVRKKRTKGKGKKGDTAKKEKHMRTQRKQGNIDERKEMKETATRNYSKIIKKRAMKKLYIGGVGMGGEDDR